MGIPRKGSRKVEVDGETFLWRVRGDSYSKQWKHASPIVLSLTCQRDEEDAGRVMQVTLRSLRPPRDTPDYEPTHKATLHPNEVRQIIVHALSKGWDPSERGSAFKLEPRDRQPELAQYEIVEPV